MAIEQYTIHAKKAKCAFMCDAVEQLGLYVDASRVHTPCHPRLKLYKNPLPKNVQELKSFLGLLHYYGKFLSNLTILLPSLNALLMSESKWCWSAECLNAFKAAKKLLVTAPVLAHYNPSLPIQVVVDGCFSIWNRCNNITHLRRWLRKICCVHIMYIVSN